VPPKKKKKKKFTVKRQQGVPGLGDMFRDPGKTLSDTSHLPWTVNLKPINSTVALNKRIGFSFTCNENSNNTNHQTWVPCFSPYLTPTLSPNFLLRGLSTPMQISSQNRYPGSPTTAHECFFSVRTIYTIQKNLSRMQSTLDMVRRDEWRKGVERRPNSKHWLCPSWVWTPR
jgi:hypothetical protein